jgi:hypothetical protein
MEELRRNRRPTADPAMFEFLACALRVKLVPLHVYLHGSIALRFLVGGVAAELVVVAVLVFGSRSAS